MTALAPSKAKPKAAYSIRRLLANGIQMFDDLEPEQLAALGAAIGRKGALIDPVTITEDEILVDGHQRLRAMLGQGRERISGADVRIIAATAANALEISIQLNVTRRHLSTDQKAELARRLQHERGWSQGTIAQLFGVSRPAVNQWLNKPERFEELGLTLTPGAGPDEDEPPVVLGADGKAYPAKLAKLEREPVSPWRPDGHAFRTLHKLKLELEHDRALGLNPLQAAKLDQEAADVAALLEGLRQELAELVLPPSYIR